MEKTDFARIFKDAWNITWKNRFLWWLGFFMFVGSGLSSFSYHPDSAGTVPSSNQAVDVLAEYAQRHPVFALFGAVAIALISLGIIALGIMSRAAAIKAAHNMGTYRSLKLWALIAAGAPYFWKILLVEILFGAFLLFFILLLAVPVVSLMYFGALALGIFAALWAVAILLPILFMAYVIRQYAILGVVLADFTITASITMAYGLFKKKMGESLMMTVWMIALGFVFALVLLSSLLLVSLVFVLIGFILYALLAQVGAYLSIGMGLLCWIAAVLFFGSLYEIFKQAAWVLMFKEISMKKVRQQEDESEKVPHTLPSPEAV